MIIPGLIKCGKDLKCFLPALDKGVPAAVTRSETVKEGTAVVTMDSTWWTTQCVADRCSVSFRVDTLEARVNDDVVPDDAKIRAGVESRFAENEAGFRKHSGAPQGPRSNGNK